jgi:hypothetical protein
VLRSFAFGLLFAAGLYGQKTHKFSWQDACFNNSTAPYCMGHEDAIKRSARTKEAVARNAGTPREETPLPVISGGIDWRFADPLADAIAGFDLKEISASPLARRLVIQLGLAEGVTEADMKKKLGGLFGVRQVAISTRDSRIVAMISGASVSTLPALQAGWKAVPVSTGGSNDTILVGHADAVDQALQRIAMNGPLSESTRLAQERQLSSEFWAVGSGRFIGPQGEGPTLQRFSLALSVQDRFASDVTFEFNGVPNAGALPFWPTLSDAAIENNTIRTRTSLEGDEAQQRVGQMANSSLGQRLAALVMAVRYLPFRDITVLKQTKPVIYGLDGGPKVIN